MRAIPSYYLRYFYFTERRAGAAGARDAARAEVMEIERELLEMYRDPALDVKPKLLEQRGGAFYSRGGGMLVESLHDDRGDVQVVNVRNDGAIPNMDDDAVVEVPCRIDADGRAAAAAASATAGDARPGRAGQGVRAADGARRRRAATATWR